MHKNIRNFQLRDDMKKTLFIYKAISSEALSLLFSTEPIFYRSLNLVIVTRRFFLRFIWEVMSIKKFVFPLQ